MLNDFQIYPNSPKGFSIDLIENFLEGHNLGKNQIISQSISQLKQSLITLNSLISDLNSNFSNLDSKTPTLIDSFDSDYLLLFFIQRKNFIISRYKKILKRHFFDEMKLCIGQLTDSNTKEQLKVLLNKLEYIETNSQSISGHLQNLVN